MKFLATPLSEKRRVAPYECHCLNVNYGSLPGVGGVEARDPGAREFSRLSTFDADGPALLQTYKIHQPSYIVSPWQSQTPDFTLHAALDKSRTKPSTTRQS